MHHPGLDVAFGMFHFAEPVDAFIGGDADNRVLANDGAAQIGDLHGQFLFVRKIWGGR
jgi:hypothetical protein